ncbi:MAG: undecaprenyldiphospho-muramoylpentapeptide beta-N-acetylglucosaminyltransferase [Rhizobiaceae bacterium]|nr:undecaprenyldiphospho-muramoylpentapeptide beta-N-acetylglucosaminyltransferase [Rhizobiaceae bacterium]
MEKGTIFLAAGGTGGHLFPAEALAHELQARGWRTDLVTDSRAERYAGKFPATEIHTVASATFGSRNPAAMARTLWSIWTGVRQSSALIGKVQPKAVVGFGGYPTLPPVYAATRRGVPTIIHEQNAVMGRANKALAARVNAIAGGFLKAVGTHGPKVVETGNPVRPAVIAASKVPFKAPAKGKPFNLLVFGGSQGAQFFANGVPAAIALLPADLQKRLKLTQQARPEDEAGVRDAYARMGVNAEVAPFFGDLAERMAAAHLVISRSGASTVSEIAAIGRPAILVPYPHALDHDQAANAAALAATGGVQVVPQSELSPERLAELISSAIADPKALAAQAAASKSAGRPEATRLLADMVEAIAGGKSVAEFRGNAANENA